MKWKLRNSLKTVTPTEQGGSERTALMSQVCITYGVDRLIMKIQEYNLKQMGAKKEVELFINQGKTGKETLGKSKG